MKRKLFNLIRRWELGSLLDEHLIRDARVRVDRIAKWGRCRIAAHPRDGSPVTVVAVGESGARAVRLANAAPRGSGSRARWRPHLVQRGTHTYHEHDPRPTRRHR